MTSPVNLNEIISYLGLEILHGDFEDSRLIAAYDKKKKRIFLKQNMSYPLQAFSTAHEIGHFILHEKSSDLLFRKDAYFLMTENRKEENEANWFAACLLIPRKEFFQLYSVINSASEIASRFAVPFSLLKYRLTKKRGSGNCAKTL